MSNGKECRKQRCKKTSVSGSPWCSKHKHQESKKRDPVGYFYQALKSNAKRRKKEFTLTKEQFAKFCEETGYLKKKGRSVGRCHIDRIDPSKGYHYDNIQILTSTENVRKRWEDEKNNLSLPF